MTQGGFQDQVLLGQIALARAWCADVTTGLHVPTGSLKILPGVVWFTIPKWGRGLVGEMTVVSE